MTAASSVNAAANKASYRLWVLGGREPIQLVSGRVNSLTTSLQLNGLQVSVWVLFRVQ